MTQRAARVGEHRSPPTLAGRITAACLLVAIVAVGAAGLVAVRLVAVTARTVTQDVLAQQADVVAAQLTDPDRAGPALGMRRVVEVLSGQGVTVVLVTPRGVRNPGGLAQVLERAGVHQVLDGQSISADVRWAGVRYLVEARPTPTGGFALLREADTGLLGSGLVRRNLGFALLVGVAVAVVVGLVVGHLLARPLRRTATAARTLRSGRRDVRVPESGPAEVSDVAGAVNELADALARSEERQRRFLLSVSHELRTPLTAIRGFAESIADGVVTGDGGADAASVIVREAHRLDRLVADLMELARLEADDFRLDPTPVNLAALVADASPVWAARCADADVRLDLRAGPTAPVRADPGGCGRCSTASRRTRCA
ncbi:MAG: histidine kinase [Pseudonocardia sp.]|nr:histidine kinase [Pseudonocardia sp.]